MLFPCIYFSCTSRKSKQVEQALTEKMLPRRVWFILSRPASLGHLSSSLLRDPVRLFIEAAQVGVSQDVSSAYLPQPTGPRGSTVSSILQKK